MKKNKLVIDSLFNLNSSLGITGYNLTKEFLKQDKYDVKVHVWDESNFGNQEIADIKKDYGIKNGIEFNNADIGIRKCDPVSAKHTPGKFKIAYVYYDGETIDSKIIDDINKFVNVLAVPSNNTKEKFVRFGVKIPVEVVPLGVNVDVFKVIKDIKKNDEFTFINYGEQGKRKGTDLLIKAFSEEFTEDENVRLDIIGTRLDHVDLYKDDEIIKNNSQIHYTRESLSRQELVERLNKSHCYIASTRADSFGMPGLEAMGCGLPVIATNQTGYSEYVRHNENGCLINNINGEPDFGDIKKQMRDMYKVWKEWRDFVYKMSENAIETANEYTWKNTVNRFNKIIEKYYKEETEKVSITVGTKDDGIEGVSIPTIRFSNSDNIQIKRFNHKKIKILWYSDFLKHTGFGNVAENLVERLNKTGKYDFTIIGINHNGSPYNIKGGDYYDFKDIPIYPAWSPNNGDMFGKGKVKEFIEKANYDIFFAFQDLFNLTEFPHHVEQAKKKRDIKYVLYFPVDGDLKIDWMKNALLPADYGMTYCPWGASKVKELLPNYEPFLLPHGVDLEQFYQISEEDRKIARKELFNVDDDTFVITSVNRNMTRKDMPRLLMAYKLFRHKYPDIKSKLYLHCDSKDNSGYNLDELALKYLPKKIANEISTMNMEKHHINGVPVFLLNRIYNASDVLTSASRGEGWSLQSSEAMATKKPLVIPANSANLDIIGANEERGYLVKSGGDINLYDIEQYTNIYRPIIDINDMADKWKYVYDHPEEVNEKVEVAYEWVKKFTWDKVANDLDKFLEMVYKTIEK